MAYYKLNADGTIQSSIKKINESWKDLNLLEKKEDGNYYAYYKEDGSIDEYKEEWCEYFKKNDLFHEQRDKLVSEITVEFEGHIYQGDQSSQMLMLNAIVSLETNELINWTDLSNEDVSLTLSQLSEIKRKAGLIQSSLWSQGRPDKPVGVNPFEGD